MNKTIIISIVIVSCVAIAFFFLRNIFKPEPETTTLYCGPDKSSPAIVFKNPTKAFPSFASEYTSKIAANISVMDSLLKGAKGSGGGGIDLSNKVVELRDKLNNESSRMEMLMKSNFFAYNSKPCDTGVSRRYFEFLTVMADKNAELEKLKANITIAPSKGGNDSANLVVIKDTVKIKQALNQFVRQYDFQKTQALVEKTPLIIKPQPIDEGSMKAKPRIH